MVIIGAGVPKRSMGHYHAKQFLDGPVAGARLAHVVEPYLLGKGKSSPEAAVFREWAASVRNVTFHPCVNNLPPPTGSRLAFVCGRTGENPELFTQIVPHCSHVYLEKPGAESRERLVEMAAHAAAHNTSVYMGYNKNVSAYVLRALDIHQNRAGGTITFAHNNAYTPDQLDECFERNAEGILLNMAIHELAILRTHFGTSVGHIADVILDRDFSVCETRGAYTDFSRLAFTLRTHSGQSLGIRADRYGCGVCL